MMQGYVNENYEAMISVAVKNGGSLKSFDAVIDTGFTGFLSLPIAIIIELGLQWNYRDRATLGDGSETVFDVYNAEIVWNGQLREIEIDAAETEPLLGMALLRGYRLQVDTIEGGLVTVETLLNLG
ncbi:MAG: clan AA aspartic protease [Cyanobacteria bacterium CAN_BIN43]|nr:clan AA aspartic protease [Cyanobacteria bacterium CAN_BIN43]